MSINVTETQIVTFQNNMELALQPDMSELWPHAMPHPGSGKLVELTNLFAPVTATEKDTRHGDTVLLNSGHSRRWIAKDRPVHCADIVDSEDQLRAGIDIAGGYTTSFAASLARHRDERFMKGFYGTARTGETGATSVPFPAGRIVAANVGGAAATGMNVEKLIEAARLLKAGFVSMKRMECYIAVTSVQYAQLLRDVRATSNEFISLSAGQLSAIESGVLPKLLGFNFVELEYGDATMYPNAAPLTLDGNGHRRVMVWAKPGMARVTWGPEVNTKIGERADKQYATQVYAECDVAATRVQEGYCAQILCAE